MGQGSGYNPGYYGGGFGYPQRMSQPFMGGKGGGMGGMGGMGGYPQMYQTQMPQWAMSQPQFCFPGIYVWEHVSTVLRWQYDGIVHSVMGIDSECKQLQDDHPKLFLPADAGR